MSQDRRRNPSEASIVRSERWSWLDEYLADVLASMGMGQRLSARAGRLLALATFVLSLVVVGLIAAAAVSI